MRRLLRTIRQFFGELRRRNVYQVAVTYVIVGVFVIEAADLTLTRLGLPPWTVTLVVVLVGLGFPIALVMAWALELTPEGVRVEEAAAEETDGSETIPGPTSTTRDLWVGASVLVLLVFAGWWLFGDLADNAAPANAGSARSEIEERSIAVLPFEVTGSGAEEWQDGMVTALSMTLDGAAGLRAISERRTFAAAQQIASTERGAMERPGLVLARSIGAQYAIIGQAVQIGGELRLGAEVWETATGRRLGQPEVRGPPDRAMALADQLTRKVLGVLLERSDEAIPSVDLASITTASLPALKDFLAGERHFRAGRYDAAIENYRAAIREDSTFALAHARLLPAGSWSGQFRTARRGAKRAYQLSDRLPERERRLATALHLWYNQFRSRAAADSLRRLSEAYPDDPTVWFYLGEVLFHNSVPRGVPEAEVAFETAVALDPGLAAYHHHLVELAFSLHRDSTLAAQRIAAHPAGEYKQLYQLVQDIVFGPADQRDEVLAQMDGFLDTISGEVLDFALWHPRDGAIRETVLRRLKEREDIAGAPQRYYAQRLVASLFGRGQTQKALGQLAEDELGAPASSCLLAGALSLGVPLPESTLRSDLEPSQLSDDAPAALFCAGIALLEQERSDEIPALIRRIQTAGDEHGVPAHDLQGMVDELRGYRAWKAGNLKRAARLWERSSRPGRWAAANTWLHLYSRGAICRGDLYRTLGRLEKAEGWYLAAWEHPVAHERLGQLYEQMGKPEKAASAYERFVEAWKNADPQLQPRIETARRRLARLDRTAKSSSSADRLSPE